MSRPDSLKSTKIGLLAFRLRSLSPPPPVFVNRMFTKIGLLVFNRRFLSSPLPPSVSLARAFSPYLFSPHHSPLSLSLSSPPLCMVTQEAIEKKNMELNETVQSLRSSLATLESKNKMLESDLSNMVSRGSPVLKSALSPKQPLVHRSPQQSPPVSTERKKIQWSDVTGGDLIELEPNAAQKTARELYSTKLQGVCARVYV